jgi:hypothetical protein
MKALAAEQKRLQRAAARSTGAGGSQLYKETENGIVWVKATRLGEVEFLVCNFTARITEELCEDDGAETRRVFQIAVRQGARRAVISVAAEKFSNMHWVTEALGARGILTTGPAMKDNARAAIQLLSQNDVVERRVYKHTGWRKINGTWVYLHAGGAIGPHGTAAGIDVVLPPALERYVLPSPP